MGSGGLTGFTGRLAGVDWVDGRYAGPPAPPEPARPRSAARPRPARPYRAEGFPYRDDRGSGQRLPCETCSGTGCLGDKWHHGMCNGCGGYGTRRIEGYGDDPPDLTGNIAYVLTARLMGAAPEEIDQP